LFDRYHAAQLGGHAVDMLLEGMMNAVAVLQYTREKGFHLGATYANDFRDRWGLIHARRMHPSFYDPLQLRPSQIGIDYLLPIFTRSVGSDDVEVLRRELFEPSKLKMQYHSLNTDVNKRIRYLESE
jgi:6-phosphofructokinase 1